MSEIIASYIYEQRITMSVVTSSNQNFHNGNGQTTLAVHIIFNAGKARLTFHTPKTVDYVVNNVRYSEPYQQGVGEVVNQIRYITLPRNINNANGFEVSFGIIGATVLEQSHQLAYHTFDRYESHYITPMQLYTPNENPGTPTVSQNIYRNKDFVLNWSEPRKGINNGIKAYRIDYHTDFSDIWEPYSTVTTNSCVISLSNRLRNGLYNKLYFRIRCVDNYNYTTDSPVNSFKVYNNVYLGKKYAKKFFLNEDSQNKFIDKIYLGNDLIYLYNLELGDKYQDDFYIYEYLSEGWLAKIKNPDSTEPITQPPLISIKEKNIFAIRFPNSQATSIDFTNFDTSNVTDMGNMFNGCQATSIDFTNFDTSKVTDMGNMFDRSQITVIDLSNFNTSNVINMSWMFARSQITTLDLSKFNTTNVSNMRFMFVDCKTTSLNLSSFNTTNVTDMIGMFQGCSATLLDLSSFDISNVTDMHDMFKNCEATTGYAKDQATCDKFNNASVTNIPSTLHFVVKP